MEYGIHWFRRDLRIAGNLALQKQYQKFNGNVLGIFCFDKKFLSRPDFSVNRFQFFLNTMVELKQELQALGGDLLVLDIGPKDGFEALFSELEKNNISYPKMISWSKDYEPFARKRDMAMKALFEKKGIETLEQRDHLIIEPNELEKPSGGAYQVYTPFSRKWLEIYEHDEVQKRILIQKNGFDYLNKRKQTKIFNLTWKKLFGAKNILADHLEKYSIENNKLVDIDIPSAGTKEAYRILKLFKKKIENYKEERDFPAISGTSKLSMFLKNGSITTAQIIYYLDLKPYSKKISGMDTFFSELIWREFYYHILFHFPEVEKEAFNKKYKDIKWENNKKLFKAWCEGKTGYPIVDAGMRELNSTGWMHNRVRMIVASFLTKDLLIDWKWGEKYFMDKLLDGDLAPNNGGWQWAASTGCDAQPYFRIFNPWTQSKKFDPDGNYIKKYIPELSELSAKELHNPILNHELYPEPIVDHSKRRLKALAMYKV